MSFGIIVKKYEHFNRSFRQWDTPKGKYISSKRQYDEQMAKEGMIPYEKAQELVQKVQENSFKPYDGISSNAQRLIASVPKDRKGNIKLGDNQIKALESMGMKFQLPDWCPKHYKEGELTDGKQKG